MADKQPVATFITQSKDFLQNRHTIYKHLDPGRQEIRLMYIKSAQYEEPIHLELGIVDLVDRPTYETISYTWEAMTPTKQVYVHGLAYNVTLNQHAALRCLRSPVRTRIMWMDVICIGQANLEERSHQVSIMGDVYAHATRADVWLGDLDESWNKEFTSEEWTDLNAVFDENRRLYCITKISPSSRRDELMRDFLVINGGFERAKFILQQLAADRHVDDFPFCTFADGKPILCRLGDPMVLFGPFEPPFSLFKDAANGIAKHIAVDVCCMETWNTVFMHPELMLRMSDIANMSIMMIASEPGHMLIDQATQLTKGRSATDTRDYVYGVLGLVQPDFRVKADYTLTTRQVFASTSWYIIKTNNDLNLLVDGGLQGGSRTVGIPTWCVDWAEVGRMGFMYNDSWKMHEEPDWERTRCNENLQLLANHITGIRVVFNRIEENEDLTDCVNHHTLVWSWIDALKKAGSGILISNRAGVDYNNNRSFLEFFSTLFRDTVASINDMSRPDLTARRLESEDWEAISKWWDLLNKSMEEGTEQQYPNTDLRTIAIAFVLSTEGYTLALTTENKLCLVPDDSTAGDSIYHVRACCPPLVLCTTGADTFQVVGPAFLHGSMGSEGCEEENEKVITLE